MAEFDTLARPYAQAAFESAQLSENFDDWEASLDVLAQVVADERASKVLNNPKIDVSERERLLLGFCGDSPVVDKIQNLARLMFENHRINVLPNVASLFKQLRGEVENTIEAEVVSAIDLSDEIKASLVAALEKRFESNVTLVCKKDDNIVGGAVVRVNDWVVDGSVSSQLTRLETALAN